MSSPIRSPRGLRQQVVGEPAPENVRRQIPALLAADCAIGNDPRVRHRLDWRRNVLLTALADDDEGMNAGRRALEHEISIGEYKTNSSIITRSVGEQSNLVVLACLEAKRGIAERGIKSLRNIFPLP